MLKPIWDDEMNNLDKFKEYYKLADILIEEATKEQLAECARLLALNLAHYQDKYGELPLDETLAMLDVDQPNESQAQLLANGMEQLVGLLGNICSALGEEKH